MFLYKDDYASEITCADLHQAGVTNEFRDESARGCPTWSVHTDMYALAEKYDVVGLKELSAQKFVAVFEKNVAFDYDVELFENVPVLQQMVAAIYLGTPEDARNRHLRQFLAEQTQAMLEHLYEKAAFKELTKVFPDFGWDVMVATAGERKKCGKCGTVVVVIGKPACGCRLASGLACGEEACVAACRSKAAKGAFRCPGCGEGGAMRVVER
jgi:ribosomal protein S27AE